MNYRGVDHYTADWGCVWLHGRRDQSPCMQAFAVAWAEQLPLSVMHSANAAANCGLWCYTGCGKKSNLL